MINIEVLIVAKIRRKCSKCGRTGHYKTTCQNKVKKTKRKTTKKKTKRSAKDIRGYSVYAYYSTKKHGWGALDGKIAKAAGRRESGAGTDMRTGIRDIDFYYRRKDAAERCAKRLRKVKGVSKVKIHPIEA